MNWFIISLIILGIFLIGMVLIVVNAHNENIPTCNKARDTCMNSNIVPWVTASCLRAQECERQGK